MRFTAKKTATLGILTGLSLIAYILESLLPSIALPGAKIGISNVFTLITVVVYGLPEGLILTVIRTTLGALVTGSLSALVYSLTAGMVSTVLMYVLYSLCKDRISIVAVSVSSAVAHNITQSAVFCLITNTKESFLLLPYLGLFGIISGVIVGLLSLLILKTVPSTVWGDSKDKGGNIENT